MSTTRILGATALGLLFLSLGACDTNRRGSEATTSAEIAPAGPDTPLPSDRFEIRVMTAEWCHYCKQVPALLEKLRVDFPTVRFREFDMEAVANAKLRAEYMPEVFPYFVLLDGGKVIDRARGLQEHGAYAAHIRKKMTRAASGGR